MLRKLVDTVFAYFPVTSNSIVIFVYKLFGCLLLSLDMMMYFHGGFNEIILFECWTIDSVGTAEIIGIFNYCTVPTLSSGLCAYTLHLEQALIYHYCGSGSEPGSGSTCFWAS
jgi:hypothetical protein